MSLRRFSGVGFLIGGLLLLASLVTALLVAQPGDAAGTEQGPVAAYSFDEGTGTTVADTTGHGHTATIEGAKWARGRYGDGLEFKGSEHNVVKVPASSELNFEEEFTLEAWVRPASSTDKLAPIVGKTTGGGSGSKSLSYYLYAGNSESKPYGEVQHVLGTGKKATATTAPPGATWTHLALTYDGAVERLFVNGVQVAETSTEAPVTTTGELQIGAETEHSEWFSGRIDEVRIYNRVLNAGEVASDMEAPIQTPKAGPVAAYSFDEGEGTTVEDVSGHGHTATIEGAKWARGRYGDGLEFKGSEHDVVKVPASSELNFEEEFTLEAWVRPTSSTDKNAPIVGKTTGGGSGSKSLSYYLYAGNSESKPYGEVQHSLGTGKQANAATAPPGATWTHLALTYDGAKERLYVNGVQVDDEATAAPVTTTGELQIGAETEHSEYFSGRIDEVRIYNRVLNSAEVGADMEAPLITPKEGPVAAYSFDEGSGTTVADVTGHGHTGTIEGAEWTDGRYGGGLNFGSGSPCVSVPDSPELRLSEEFTLEAWVRPVGGIYEDPVVVRESGGKPAFGLGLGDHVEGEPEGFIGTGKGSEVAFGGGPVQENEWTPVATTYDGGRIRVYEDGELVAEQTASTPPATGEGPLKIGCDTPDGPFTGKIDEVRVYNRALDGAEVDADGETPLQTPKATPVAAYSFDEENEETAADTTGDGHTATVEGARWTEHGRYGGAMEFDAAEEDVLKIPASPELDFGEEFTLEAWVRPSGADNHSAPLIDKQEGGALGYFLYEGGSVSDRPYGAAGEEQEFIHAEEPLPADAWSHVALVFDGNRTGLYVDGELVDNGAAAPTVTSEGELEIGGSTDTSDWFDGRIDEVRIYNRALDEAEVDSDMEAPIQTPKKGPVAAWSFDEGEGTTVEDLTGDGHTATIHGAKWSSHGKYGGAMEFAEGDWLSVPASPELDLTEEFTLEAWIHPETKHEFDDILSKETAEEPSRFAYLMADHHGQFATYFGEYPENAYYSPHEEITPHTWTHVAVVDGGGRIHLYLDGEEVESGPAPSIISTDGELRIGSNRFLESHDDFIGRIDEVRIYNRALTQSEMQATMNSTFPKAVTEVGTEIESNDAMMTGTAQVKGSESTYYFEYGPTTSYGSVASGGELDGNGQAVQIEEAAIDLSPETTYHYRIAVESPLGTSYGQDATFTTGERTISVEEEEEEQEEEEGGGEELSLARLSGDVNPLAKTGSGNFFGIDWDGHLDTMANPDTKSNDFARIAASGAKFVRFRVSPGQPGVPGAFKEAKRLGLTALPYVGEAGSYTGSKGYFNYTIRLMEEYGPGTPYETDYWEIGNEPNRPPSSTTEEGLAYAKDWAEYYEEMVREVRNAKVTGVHFILAGLYAYEPGREGHITPRQFLNRVNAYLESAKPKLSDPYQGISIHPYVFKVRDPKHPSKGPHAPGTVKGSEAEDAEQEAKDIQRRIKEFQGVAKTTPIWVTEFGFPLESAAAKPGESKIPVVSEPEQAALVRKSMSMLWARREHLNIAHAIYYNIQDVSEGPQWANHTGLLKASRAERPAWKAFIESVGAK
jgi:Concanavalin A-like lectin/glucanases superfamily